MNKTLYLGQNPLSSEGNVVRGQQVTMDGEDFYEIVNYDEMRPFLMSIVSS